MGDNSEGVFKERHYYIDALRVIAIFLMFVYHVSMIFVAEWGWHIKNTEQSSVLLEVNYWMAFFRMPLLFLVSAYISYMLLAKLTWKSFVVQRFNRLIIPTIIWTFILVAPQIYFEKKLLGFDQSYFEFYKTFLDFKWWPEGNFHWLHLWFIPYLFFYNVLSIPIYRFLNKEGFLVVRIDRYLSSMRGVFVFILIAITPYTFLTVHYPVTYDFVHDYARHSFYIFFILGGLFLFKFNKALLLIESRRQVFFRLAFIAMIVINVLRWNDWEPYNFWENWIEKPQAYCYIALLNFNSWLWVLVFVGYGKRYLNKDSMILRYCNGAVYPFYILHQTIIVIIGYYVVQTSDDVFFKYMFILLVCLFFTISAYHFFIRPFGSVRFLFGCK